MRKLVEDLNLQTNEKDAEIIKLKMDIADKERSKMNRTWGSRSSFSLAE
jgi:hypothetical protein